MRILLYALNLFGKTGVATYVKEMTHALVRRGHHVDVGIGTLSRKEWVKFDQGISGIYNTTDFSELKKHEYDIVHIAEFTISRYYTQNGNRASFGEASLLYNQAYKNFLKVFRDIPKTIRIHGPEHIKKSPLFYHKYWSNFDGIIAASDEAVPLQCLNTYYKILLPIEIGFSKPFNFENKRNFVVSAVKIMKEKGVQYLLKICQKINETVEFWGEIIDQTLIEANRANLLGGNVHLAGEFSDPAIPYSGAKVACNLSVPMLINSKKFLSRLEYATLEAMKYGAVPLVFSPFSTVYSVIGINWFPSKEKVICEELNLRINNILENETLYQDYALNNYNFIRRHHNSEKVIPCYERVWSNLVTIKERGM